MDEMILENLVVTQLVKKFPEFYVTKCSLPYSQQPASDSCSEPDEFRPQNFILFLRDPV